MVAFIELEPPVTLPLGIGISRPEEIVPLYFQLCLLSQVDFRLEVYLTSSGIFSISGKSSPASRSKTEMFGSSVNLVAIVAPAEPAPITI